jgi:hypothetical protein
MKYTDIPVVLVVAGKKIEYIPYVIKNLNYYCGFELFYVICPNDNLDRARSLAAGIKQQLIVIDENLIVSGLSLSEVRKYLKLSLADWPEHHLPGWYFQQFLKMGFAKYAPNHSKYLIWDSDTLLTRSISFFDGDAINLTQGNEFHKEYFETIEKLFDNITLQSVSHISQHLMVLSEDMSKLIQRLETTDAEWWVNILSSLNGKTPFQFSEYETYANFCLSTNPKAYRSIRRMWFRYGKSYFGCDLPLADTYTLSKLYDFVAFEDWDFGKLRSIRSSVIVMYQRLCSIFGNSKK